MSPASELPVVAFASDHDWETWLEAQHATSDGVWLRLAKKASGIPSVTYAEAVLTALCFGWIDGQAGRGDEVSWLQKFTPRRARSRWSQINCGRAEALASSGRMRPAGAAQVAAAKADGRWDAAYASPANATVPDDLRDALAVAGLTDTFERLTGAQRFAILYRVQDAKRPDTRARRIDGFVAMLADGQTPHGPVPPESAPRRVRKDRPS